MLEVGLSQFEAILVSRDVVGRIRSGSPSLLHGRRLPHLFHDVTTCCTVFERQYLVQVLMALWASRGDASGAHSVDAGDSAFLGCLTS